MRAHRSTSLGLAVAFAVTATACTALLGDDFTIEPLAEGGRGTTTISGGQGGLGGSGASGGEGAGQTGGGGGVVQGDFTFFIVPLSVSVPYDGTNLVAVQIARGAGFTDAVTVEVQGAPAGLVWQPLELAPSVTEGALTVGATGTLVLGTEFELTLRATSGVLAHDDSIPAVVTGTPGTLDESFGTAGITAWLLGSDGGHLPAIRQVAQSKILVAGSKYSGLGAQTFAGARLLVDGSLDTSFDVDGIVGAQFCSCTQPSFAVGVSRAVNGNVYLVGSGDGGSGFTEDIALLRLKDDGTPDDDIAHDGGLNLFDLGGLGMTDTAWAMEPDDDDLPIITGDANDALFVAHIGDLSFGGLDGTYGTNGYVMPDVGASPSSGRAIAIDTDGNAVVAGLVGDASADIVVLRLTRAGALDTTFANAGVFRLTRTGAQTPASVRLRGDGRILVAGATDELGTSDILLLQLLPSGQIDPDFGTDGVVVTSSPEQEEVVAMALMLDGRMVVACNAPSPMVARFLVDGAPDATFGGDGTQTMNLGIDAEIDSMTLSSDGKILLAGTRETFPTDGLVARVWN